MASIQDNFEINVATKRADGRWNHFCKIELPEYAEDQAKAKLDKLREIFGDEYKLDMTHWVCCGHHDDNW